MDAPEVLNLILKGQSRAKKYEIETECQKLLIEMLRKQLEETKDQNFQLQKEKEKFAIEAARYKRDYEQLQTNFNRINNEVTTLKLTNEKLTILTNQDQNKRQKLRRVYRTLDENFRKHPSACVDEETKKAMTILQNTLKTFEISHDHPN